MWVCFQALNVSLPRPPKGPDIPGRGQELALDLPLHSVGKSEALGLESHRV